ncbi:MAG: hypothetical protein ABIP79_13290 [Chitinophagaceae bacterium]
MNKLLSILLFASLSSCVYTKKIETLFRDKIIVYSAGSLTSDTNYNANEYYIAYYNDSIRRVNHEWGKIPEIFSHYDTTERDDQIVIKPIMKESPYFSDLPYLLTRLGNYIYIEYKTKGKRYKDKIYSIKKNDSTDFTPIEHIHNGFSFKYGQSAYKRDTTINLYGYKLKCYVFNEYYRLGGSHGPNNRKVIVYREKRTLIPIRMITQFYLDNHFMNPRSGKSIDEISFILSDKTKNSRPKWKDCIVE